MYTRKRSKNSIVKDGMKICPQCDRNLKTSEYHRHKSKKDGIRSWCKKCEAAYSKKRNMLPEEILKKKERRLRKLSENPRYYLDLAAKRKAADPEGHSRRLRANNLRKKYGISINEYESMFTAVDGVCEICTNKFEMSKIGERLALVVDHDHKTGAVRGIPCSNCNAGLGMFNDDIENLRRAILYLEKHAR